MESDILQGEIVEEKTLEEELEELDGIISTTTLLCGIGIGVAIGWFYRGPVVTRLTYGFKPSYLNLTSDQARTLLSDENWQAVFKLKLIPTPIHVRVIDTLK